MRGAHPILSCEQARAFEAAFFAGDEAREWAAMQAAGRALAAAAERDFAELGSLPSAPRVLVLAGKGHNGGDALIAAAALRERHPRAALDVVFPFGERALRPLAARAWRELAAHACLVASTGAEWAEAYDLALDGVFGFQFRPPLPPEAAALLGRVNAHPVRLRVAVDMPSGLDAPEAFRADFTYATGIAKRPLLTLPHAGRLRLLDLGFFASCNPLGRTGPSVAENEPCNPIGYTDGAPAKALCHPIGYAEAPAGDRMCNPLGYTMAGEEVGDWVLTEGVLGDLRGWRAPRADKRHFGHPLIVAGSRRFPGAALMATLAALRSGAGLVSAAVPESLVPAFAAQAPEAIWIGLPETPEGSLALEGLHLIRAAWARATALVLGPGLGRERETLILAQEIARESPHPLVIDADALQPEVVAAGRTARVLTPHAGEHARLGASVPAGEIVVRKGPITRIETADGRGGATGPVYHSFSGGPVLARGGSGDLLAGIVGTLLAQTPADPLGAAARGVVWHGLAADALARAEGAVAVRTTRLLDFLAPALRGSPA